MLNASKTKVLNVSLKKTITMTDTYTINDTHRVVMENQAKLLGVVIDSHLNFGSHITSIRKAAIKECHGLLMLKKAGVN